jgi:hypothetical protein
MWLEKDERQRVLWPSIIQLSLDYFESLQQHAARLAVAPTVAPRHRGFGMASRSDKKPYAETKGVARRGQSVRSRGAPPGRQLVAMVGRSVLEPWFKQTWRPDDMVLVQPPRTSRSNDHARS